MKFMMIFIMAMAGTAFGQEIYKIKEKDIKGEDFNMSALKGKVVLIVNIASQCGYTHQLEGLEKLYRKYKEKSFVVLGVPTNDFGGQTPEDDKSMLDFCQKNYNVTFPVLTKKTVQGKDKRDLYKYLTEKTAKELQGSIAWNFEKFLVNKKGEVVARFNSATSPEDDKLLKKLTHLLE